MTNYYQILGVPSTATGEQIKSAYREYAKNFHPDLHKNSDFFKQRFQDVQQAYEVLSSTGGRQNFDKTYANASTGHNEAIAELNRKVTKLANEVKVKDSHLTGALSTNAELKKENNELINTKSILESKVDELEKKIKRSTSPSKVHQITISLKHFFRPPLSYLLLIVGVIVVGAFVLGDTKDKRINLVKEMKIFHKYEKQNYYTPVILRMDSLIKSDGKINESDSAIIVKGRRLERSDLMMVRGLAKLRINNDTGAIRDYTLSIINRKVPSSFSYSGRAFLKKRIGDKLGSLADANKAIELDKYNSYAYAVRAELLFDTQRYAEALADYKSSARINPTDAYSLYSAGFCYSIMSKKDSACIMWRRASELGSQDATDAMKNIGYCN